MKCPECGSFDLVSGGNPISTGGSTFFPRRCNGCGFFWSTPKPLTVGPKPAQVARRDVPVETPAAEPPPAETSEEPPAPPAETERIEEVPTDDIELGDVVVFMRAGAEVRGPVVKINAKSYWVDLDGVPDKNVRKDRVLGRVVKA